MSGLLKLNEAARRAAVHVLAPAEPIIFVTMPDPDEAARAAWPTAAAGALLAALGAPLAWVAIDASLIALRSGGIPWMAMLFALNLHAVIWWRSRTRREWLAWLAANVVVALGFLPWLPTFIAQQSHALNTSPRTPDGLTLETLTALLATQDDSVSRR